MVVMMMMMVEMLMMLLGGHPHLLLLLPGSCCHRTTSRTAHAFFAQLANQSGEIGADDVFGSGNGIVATWLLLAGAAVEADVQGTSGPGRVDQFTVEPTAESPLVRFGHRRDCGKFAPHRIVAEGSLNNAGRVISPSPTAVFPFQQFNLLV